MMSFSLLPLWYQLFVVGTLGAVLASFVNVLAYRMHTSTSISGRSRCFSCGHTLSWYELVPVFSYLALSGRCRVCHAHIAWRDVVVEITMAALTIAVYLSSTSLVEFLLGTFLVFVLLLVVLYDTAHMIIPDESVLVALGVAIGLLTYRWYEGVSVPELLSYAVVSLMILAGTYAFLWIISRGRWIGLGDAKLAAPLALVMTPFQAFSTVVLSFWVGAVIACLLLFIQFLSRRFSPRVYARTTVANTHKYLTMKSEIPFAPFLVLAFLLVYFGGVNVLSLFSYALW